MSSTDDTRRSLTGVRNAVHGLVGLYSLDRSDSSNSLLLDGPDPVRVLDVLRLLLSVLLPGRMEEKVDSPTALDEFLERTLLATWKELQLEVAKALPYRWLAKAERGKPANQAELSQQEVQSCSVKIVEDFISRLPELRKQVISDIEAAYDGDPAALSYAEVKLAYPGILAVSSYRIAHALYQAEVPIIPRIMSEWVHTKTGIDIHPGAEIGNRFFIDHATGVVIGETACIGNNVKFYQGVTLGARSFSVDSSGNPVKHVKRHPTVCDNVVIYAHATILGGDTVVGEGSVIGGNVFLMESVPAGSVVVRDGSGSRVVSKL